MVSIFLPNHLFAPELHVIVFFRFFRLSKPHSVLRTSEALDGSFTGGEGSEAIHEQLGQLLYNGEVVRPMWRPTHCPAPLDHAVQNRSLRLSTADG